MTTAQPTNGNRNCFVLCFDGTGNSFTGDERDSNVLKIYRLLDHGEPNQYSWYNAGLGTYVESSNIEHTSPWAKTKSWWLKTRDLAFGTSQCTLLEHLVRFKFANNADVGDHVMAGYKFLMRYYTTEDDLYLFGFSRGAYTARFLAEMLDTIGLLASGNDSMQRFAWKVFASWQARKGKYKRETKALYTFMKGFRETFCRPVRRIRFVGLFDVVCSVPRFENAFLKRTKYPFSAQTSAKIIRHAVSVDERRAKFRVDLISERSGAAKEMDHAERPTFHRYLSDLPSMYQPKADEPPVNSLYDWSPFRKHQYQDSSKAGESIIAVEEPAVKTEMPAKRQEPRRRFSDVQGSQDILEVWFPGNHGDVGGGSRKDSCETWPLSHQALVWMVQEAQQAGLKFNEEKLVGLNCSPLRHDEFGNVDEKHETRFLSALRESATKGVIHDCLEYRKGTSGAGVAGWRLLEYLPTRRMDLKPDSTWQSIHWPLPRGEVRDIPRDAKIHHSVIERMNADKKYRPGNIIMLGEGGRGRRRAPSHLGIREWVVYQDRGGPHELLINKAYAKELGIDDSKQNSTITWLSKSLGLGGKGRAL